MKITHWVYLVLLSLALVLTSHRTSIMAAKLTVSPVVINLLRGSSSETVTITNADDGDIRMQIQGYTWTKSENGHPLVQPTEEIVIFPELVIIPAHTQRNIRIGTTVQSGPTEKAYRILFSQLPDNDNKKVHSGITFITSFSVPLFLAPAVKPKSELLLPSATIHPSFIDFDLENLGTAHVTARELELTGYGAQGQIVMSLKHPAWYLLPGEIVHFKAPITHSQSIQIARLKIDVIADMANDSFGITPQHSDP